MGQWCREAGSHSLGVTQSLMYAFSGACIVFTTANSSAMLSYLRGGADFRRGCPGRKRGLGTPASPALVPLSGAPGLAPPHPTPSRGFWGPVSLGRPPWWGDRAATGAGLTSPAHGRSCTASLPVGRPGGGSRPAAPVSCGAPERTTQTRTTVDVARKVPTTHLIQLRLVSRGCDRTGRVESHPSEPGHYPGPASHSVSGDRAEDRRPSSAGGPEAGAQASGSGGCMQVQVLHSTCCSATAYTTGPTTSLLMMWLWAHNVCHMLCNHPPGLGLRILETP